MPKPLNLRIPQSNLKEKKGKENLWSQSTHFSIQLYSKCTGRQGLSSEKVRNKKDGAKCFHTFKHSQDIREQATQKTFLVSCVGSAQFSAGFVSSYSSALPVWAGLALPLPSPALFLSAGLKDNEAEFVQYRLPVGRGPSSKICPR